MNNIIEYFSVCNCNVPVDLIHHPKPHHIFSSVFNKKFTFKTLFATTFLH